MSFSYDAVYSCSIICTKVNEYILCTLHLFIKYLIHTGVYTNRLYHVFMYRLFIELAENGYNEIEFYIECKCK